MPNAPKPDINPAAIERALARLPRLERDAFLLKVRDGLTYGAIGSALGITPELAEACVARALIRLDALLLRIERPWWRFWSG